MWLTLAPEYLHIYTFSFPIDSASLLTLMQLLQRDVYGAKHETHQVFLHRQQVFNCCLWKSQYLIDLLKHPRTYPFFFLCELPFMDAFTLLEVV